MTRSRGWSRSPSGNYSRSGYPLRSVTGSVLGRRNSFGRRVMSALVWIGGAAILIGLLLLWNSRPSQRLPPEPMPPLLRLWAAVDDDHVSALLSVLEDFEHEHGVQIELHNNLPPSYDLVRTLMSGYGPDVMLIDAEMSARLLGLEALQPLSEPIVADAGDPGERPDLRIEADPGAGSDPDPDAYVLHPDAYILRLAEESLWVRSLRAVIPLHVRDAALARQFVAYIAGLDGVTHVTPEARR